MPALRVLLVTGELAIGGEELSTLSIAVELRKRNHRVYWMSSAGPLLHDLRSNDIPFVQARVAGRTVRAIVQGSYDMRRFISAAQVDIVHSQSVVPAIRAFLAARVLRRPPKLVWHDRGIREGSYPLVGRLFNYASDLVIANSNSERQKLISHGLGAHKVITIHNCVNFDFPATINPDPTVRRELGIRDGDWVVGTVRRLHPEKGGHRQLLIAASSLVHRVPRLRLLIVGGGPLENELRAHAARLGLAETVIFAGFRRDLPRLYPIMDVFVLPSTWEPFGNVVAEAMAFGKPIVATRVGGIPEIVDDGRTGLLVAPSDPVALADAIYRLASDRPLAAALGTAARREAGIRFTRARLGSDIEGAYRRLLGSSVAGESCGSSGTAPGSPPRPPCGWFSERESPGCDES